MRVAHWVRGITITMLILLVPLHLTAQTYRGGIGGTVVDPQGATIANAKVVLISTATGATRETVTTSDGGYVFQDLQLGTYSLAITMPGFAKATLQNISVNPGAVTPVNAKLSISGTQETVDVSTDTTSEIQTQSSANNAVIGQKGVSEIPLNGRSFTQLLQLTPGMNSSGSLNGARSNQLNYQIDGADNNDIWQGGTAANQGGVGSIAGVTLPIEAIDQFSVQSSGSAEEGHSSGGLVSLGLKTGTNRFHGTGYFYGRSEFFAARDFFSLASARKQKVRNQQFGGSLGGPVLKDKLFFYTNYERQVYNIQLSSSADTEPGAAYVAEATQLLARHGVSSVNPLSTTLLSALWPGGNAASLGANLSNYVETHERHGYSDNVVGNLNYILSPKQTVRLQAFIGTGRQAEPGGPTYPYFQVAPDITQSFSLSHNWAPTDHLSNQLLIATGIFNQTFNDLNHSFNMPALGLNTGVTNPSLFGAPTITLSGFDGTGATQPLGRKDYTGHITDSATWIHGNHQIRFGGEFRRSYIDLQYQAGTRGNFAFTGYSSGSPSFVKPAGATAWSESTTKAQVCGTTTPLPAACGGVNDLAIIGSHTEVLALADYLTGNFNSASFTNGVLRRDLYRTDMDFFLQDQYKLVPRLVLNYGVRYDFFGDISTTGPWSVWRPGASGTDANGLIQVGTPGAPPT
ncbi:MAG TPA: TonB-dependent receptor, partial [Acidobacteriaceae bacterium]